MKASVITMTSTYNYGATMQAYALHRFVKSLGCECDLIDHMSPAKGRTRVSLTDFSKANLRKLPYKLSLDKGYARFERFYKERMNMTRRYASIAELKASPPDSDAFISGSDQVFNPRDPKLDRFLLDFAPVDSIKLSYAASIGDPHIPDEKKQRYIDGLKAFDFVSVREREAFDIIQPLTDKPVEVNCDPAFLLTAEQWRELESPVKGLKPGEYVLCYMIHMPSWINDWLREFKKKTSLKIVFVSLSGYRRVFCDKIVRNAGPGEFLWLIDNAHTVVSSSFHGNVFSMIFGKRLISTPDAKRPDRIRNLLRSFGIEGRDIYEPKSDCDTAPIDGALIEKIAAEERANSRKYLMKALGLGDNNE